MCGFLQQDFLASVPPRATNGDRKARRLESRPRRRDITEPPKNPSADCVDPFRINLKAEMFGQIVQTRIPAHEKFAIAERLDIKIRTVAWRGAAENFLDDILH